MKLLEVYSLMASGQITDKQAASAFGVTPHQFKLRLAKWKHRFPLLLATLDKIADDQISRDEAAELLGVSTRDINKLQLSWSIKRPLKAYLIEKQTIQIKWEIHKKFAIDFIAGGIEFSEAAKSAGLSTRQMRRWVADLLKKHYEMPYKDLKTLSDHRRKRLADEIERRENLEMSKQQVLKSIADGQQSIENEALNRVLSKRTVAERRRPTNA